MRPPDLAANLFLFALVVVPLVWFIITYWRTRYTPVQYVLYLIATALVRELLIRSVRELAKLAGREDFLPQIAGRRWLPADEEAAARKLANQFAPHSSG